MVTKDQIIRMDTGQSCLSKGDYSGALVQFQRHLDAVQDISVIEKISCLINIGACLIALSQYERGWETLTGVIEMIEEEPEDSLDANIAAEAHYNLAIAASKLGNFVCANDHFNVSLTLFVKGGYLESAGDVHNELALHYHEVGQIDKQISSLQSAQDFYNTAGAKNKEALVVFQLASLYCSLNDTVKCRQLLATGRMMVLTISDSAVQGQLFLKLGLLYCSLRMHQEALESFERALPLVRNGESPNEASLRAEAAVLQNIGALYNEMKRFSEAIIYHKTAAMINGKAKLCDAEVKCLCNLAFAQAQIKDYTSSASTFTLALSKAEQTLNKVLIIQALEGLGSVCYHMKKLEESKNHFEKALEITVGGGSNVGIARERIMEKLSDVVEAITVNQTDNTGTKHKPRFSLNTVDNRKLARGTSQASDDRYLTEMTQYLSNNYPSDQGSLSTLNSSESASLPNSVFSSPRSTQHTPEEFSEGCLALGPDTKRLYTVGNLRHQGIIPRDSHSSQPHLNQPSTTTPPNSSFCIVL